MHPSDSNAVALTFGDYGLRLGAAALVAKDATGRFQPCPPPLLRRYLAGREGGLQAVANALNRGDKSVAITAAIHLRLPDIPPRTFQRLMKYDPNQPRVSAGNPDGGQWTSGDEADFIETSTDSKRLVVITPELVADKSPISDNRLVNNTAIDYSTLIPLYAPESLQNFLGSAESSDTDSASAASGGYSAENPDNHALGRYQLTQQSLIDLGLKKGRSTDNWSGAFANAFNIQSDADFLKSPAAQNAALAIYIKSLMPQVSHLYKKYGGKTFRGVSGQKIAVTKPGLIAALHRAGNRSVRRYFMLFQAKNTFHKQVPDELKPVETRLRNAQKIPYDN